jgi:alpha-tubulin suppressor-like RCC1 family protein
VRCWGRNEKGQLGYGHTSTIGDDESPGSAGDVNVGGTVARIAAGGDNTCAVLTTGGVRCWGDGSAGQLGYRSVENVGDDELPAIAGDVNIGGAAVQVELSPNASYPHTCARLTSGGVRCWGYNTSLAGLGAPDRIGDDEWPSTIPEVNIGGAATQLVTGAAHACALLGTGKLRCWGSGYSGQLGYGNVQSIGDDEHPASAGDVPVGGDVQQVTAGSAHTCALLSGGTVRCWGGAGTSLTYVSVILGYANTKAIGDDELPASAGDLAIGF